MMGLVTQVSYSSEAVSFGRPSGGASRGGLPGMRLRLSTGAHLVLASVR